MLSFQLRTTHFPPLGQCYEDGLARNNLAVHFVHGPGRILWGAKAHESKSTGHSSLEIAHDTCTGNGTHDAEFIPKHIIRDAIVQVLDVEVDSLKLGNTIHLLRFVLAAKFTLTLRLLLGTSNIKDLGGGLAIVFINGEFLVVHGLDGGGGALVVGKVDKAKAEGFGSRGFFFDWFGRFFFCGLFLLGRLLFLGSFLLGLFGGFGGLLITLLLLSLTLFLLLNLTLLLLLLHNRSSYNSRLDLLGKPLPSSHINTNTDNLPILFKLCLQPLIIPLIRNVLDKHIRKRLRIRSVITTHKHANLNFLTINQHAIQLLNGIRGRLIRLIVNIAIPLGKSSPLIGNNLTTQNIPKQRKRIVQLLIINPLVQILHKDVSHAAPPHGRIALAPHDATRLALDIGKVHAVQCAIGIAHLVVVHVGVPQRAAGDGIATDADGGDGSDGVEDFEEESFVHFGEEVADVEGGGVEVVGACCSGAAAAAGGGGGGGGGCRGGCGGRGGFGCCRWGGGGSGGGGGCFFGLGSRHFLKVNGWKEEREGEFKTKGIVSLIALSCNDPWWEGR
mmetsp:Transcript_6690/g.15234  ORF Transcript_6690/g.15234 Transcript_6690/m.15234 type:complete len:558 (-) Transcript_6690:17-1690(-)